MFKGNGRAGRLYSAMLTSRCRKQHRDNLQVVLSCFLEALGISRFHASTARSPGAISRFLNHQRWSLRPLLRVLRQHALDTFHSYLRGRRGRPPLIEVIVDTTSLAKEGVFAELDGWMHTLNGSVACMSCCSTSAVKISASPGGSRSGVTKPHHLPLTCPYGWFSKSLSPSAREPNSCTFLRMPGLAVQPSCLEFRSWDWTSSWGCERIG
ncbi:hypothetical protein SAMN00790413_03417 [Deinococcus hopiensis KR-140]|uniref:Transposase DDE domain-containing protein n=1 Tax=Deinococcus hopiensis KR-140 TaxID=695939 RepID=A0A1W1UWD6_9DEIO|nr:hypothetical protein SAMN00790413_03417 [Deinococcus hopiensis KR-140]